MTPELKQLRTSLLNEGYTLCQHVTRPIGEVTIHADLKEGKYVVEDGEGVTKHIDYEAFCNHMVNDGWYRCYGVNGCVWVRTTGVWIAEGDAVSEWSTEVDGVSGVVVPF